MTLEQIEQKIQQFESNTEPNSISPQTVADIFRLLKGFSIDLNNLSVENKKKISEISLDYFKKNASVLNNISNIYGGVITRCNVTADAALDVNLDGHIFTLSKGVVDLFTSKDSKPFVTQEMYSDKYVAIGYDIFGKGIGGDRKELVKPSNQYDDVVSLTPLVFEEDLVENDSVLLFKRGDGLENLDAYEIKVTNDVTQETLPFNKSYVRLPHIDGTYTISVKLEDLYASYSVKGKNNQDSYDSAQASDAGEPATFILTADKQGGLIEVIINTND